MAGIGLVLLAAAATAHAFFVEPFWVEHTRHSLAVPVERPLKIAHLSDIHATGFGTRERRVLALLEAEAPDLIVVTGDTVTPGHVEPGRDFLRRVRAPLGVWVVRGEAEAEARIADEEGFFASAGARLLVDAGAALREDVWLLGLDGGRPGGGEAERALAGAPAAAFKLALLHAPDHFQEIAGLVNLALAGHTHGGQVRLPGLGPLWRRPGGHRFLAGWYARNASKLYVSRGLGTSLVPARLFCRPELAIIELRPL